jgi:hypothetical protein
MFQDRHPVCQEMNFSTFFTCIRICVRVAYMGATTTTALDVRLARDRGNGNDNSGGGGSWKS